jgi:general secretion pathway protein C
MAVDRIYALISNEPKQWIAIAVFIIALLLFIMELVSLYQTLSTPENITKPVMIKTQEVAITEKSPVFTWPMFGEYVPNLEDATIKQSKLDLKVVGILYSSEKKASRVIIKASDGKDQSYVVGDSLPGGAVIKKIDRKSVIVLYNGALESLSFPKNELLFQSPPKPLMKE